MTELAATAVCPSCAASLGAAGSDERPMRGRCPACGAIFDLAPVPLVGDGPLRSGRATDVRLGVGRPPGPHLVDHSGGTVLRDLQVLTTDKTKRHWGYQALYWLCAIINLAQVIIWEPTVWRVCSVIAFALLAVMEMVGWQAGARRARIRLDGKQLTVRRHFGLKQHAIPVDDIVRFETQITSTECWLAATLRNGRTIRLTRVTHLYLDERRWLADHLQQGLELARSNTGE